MLLIVNLESKQEVSPKDQYILSKFLELKDVILFPFSRGISLCFKNRTAKNLLLLLLVVFPVHYGSYEFSQARVFQETMEIDSVAQRKHNQIPTCPFCNYNNHQLASTLEVDTILLRCTQYMATYYKFLYRSQNQ